MSYLKFDKDQMINLEQSLRKEMLRTNQSGAYHCTTIVDCNTRKQHGLLVIPIKEFGDTEHVLLSSLDVTVIQHGAEFNLGLHRYKGGVYHPNGHKYIREYDCNSVPRTTYRVGGVILTKEKIFISGENRLLIRYTLVDAHSETTLRLRPHLAFRDANELCMANNALNTDCPECVNGISCCLYPGYPRLYMQFNHKPQWNYQPDWYRNFEYFKDMDRGVPYCEDLWVPGYFDIRIRKGESIIFSAGLDEVSPRSLSRMYEKEISTRTPRSSFYNCLKNAVKQCYIRQGDKMYLISGFPYGKILARNTFMALPGATIAIDHKDDFINIADTALAELRQYMETGEHDGRIRGMNLPDIPLWALWAIQQFAKNYGDEETRTRYMDVIASLINYIADGRHENLFVEEGTALLSTKGTDTPASWMNAAWDGKPIVPRSGKLVEFNALWYNALCFAQRLTDGLEDRAEFNRMCHELAEKLKPAFIETFLNDYGYLYDYVDNNQAEPSVRPNMAIAIGLEYSPLDRRQRKGVLDIVTRELLTPKGLRTLSPKSYGYRAAYEGSPYEREVALHNGPARPWLMGFYAQAYLKVFGMSGVGYIDRMLIGFEGEMTRGCIGSLSQLYDGNPPYNGRGSVSHVTNMAEVLRTLRMLKNMEAK